MGLPLAAAVASLLASTFTWDPPGVLPPGSGAGRIDNHVYVPGIRFPIESAPAFANSQVWGHGGNSGPAGTAQCDAENFSYPWRDNYCETRGWSMPLCPSGTGHQGQDIRAATCKKDVHWVVAVAAGDVTQVGSYSVYVTAPDGTRFDYLHMEASSVQVKVGQTVVRGQRLGRVSNNFNGTPTTVHLHFNIRQNLPGHGYVYVPPYLSLVTAYGRLVGVDAGTSVGEDGGEPDAGANPDAGLILDDGGYLAEDGGVISQPLAIPAVGERERLGEPLGGCQGSGGPLLAMALLGWAGLAARLRARARRDTAGHRGAAPGSTSCG